MPTIELTDEQRQALRADQGRPLDVVDPATQQHYVLLAQEQYERVRSLLEIPFSDAAGGVPAGILRSQKAFWRDLPELLKNEFNHGQWVCYHGDERIGIAIADETLIHDCVRRNIPDDEYDLFIIKPCTLPPWEPEEVEHLGSWHLADAPAVP